MNQNQLSIEVENQIGKGLSGDYNGRKYRIGKPTSFDDVSDEYVRLNNQWASEGKLSYI